jgi:hypothetical protein
VWPSPSTLEKAEWNHQGYKKVTTFDLSHTAITDLSNFAFPQDVQTIKLPAGLKTISSQQFTGRGELTNLVIPDSITQLPFEIPVWNDQPVTFEGCGKLPQATRKRIQDLGYTGSFQ